jgi:hypothetical protein
MASTQPTKSANGYVSLPQQEETPRSPAPLYSDVEGGKSYSMYASMGQPAPTIIVQDNGMPVGMILFLMGFIFTPTWWVGSCLSHDSNAKEQVCGFTVYAQRSNSKSMCFPLHFLLSGATTVIHEFI